VSEASASGTSRNAETDQVSTERGRYLLRTKFYVPPIRSNQISRPRLIDLFNRGLDKTLILVSAPAGYGKTTLVSTWLKQTGIPSAWLSLDAGDNDPIRFMQYLLTAIQQVTPGIGYDLPDMLQGVQPSHYEDVINYLTNELASIPDPFVLVLDDFHVIDGEAVANMVAHLLEHLPNQKHLVLLTRIDPPLPLSRLRVRNQLVDIRADQLRFTREETAAFLNDVMGLTLSAEDISAMETRTEGWIAGLQLAALSMQSCQDIHGFVSAFTGSHHYVMDYLVEEVLRLQPGKVGDFLLQTSILDNMCGPLCQSVAGSEAKGTVDGQAMLEDLERMNLFVIPLDDERRWYRYHHLFADVLRKHLEHRHPHLLPELHLRASQWFEQNGFVAEAVRHSLTAGDQDRAIQLIEQNGALLLIRGESSNLPNWIKAVESQSQKRPWIYIFKAWLFVITGPPERVEEMLQIAEKLISSLEPDIGVRTMQGAIATVRSWRSNDEGEMYRAASFARQALDCLPDIDVVSRSLRTVATALLGDANSMNGDLEYARQAYTEAKQIGQATGDVHLVIIVNSNLANISMEQGRLHQAAEIYAETLQMATRPDGKKLVTAGRVYEEMSQISYEWNHLETAMEQVHRSIELCKQWGNVGHLAVGSLRLARLEQVQGHPQGAMETMRIAERIASEHQLAPKYSSWVKYALARLWIAQGNVEKASRIVEEGGITTVDEIPYLREPEFLVLLRLLLIQGDHAASLALSKRMLQKAETAGRTGRVIEVLVLQALIFQSNRETEQALAVLKRALSLAKPERYVRTFADEGEPMVRLLHLARSRQIETQYATELLSVMEGAAGSTKTPPRLLTEPLTSREMEVLKLIEAGCSNQDIAEKLVISFTTVKRHISNIYTKLDVKSRTQAVAIGKELNLFE
jgi:LuxR family maltose regulon positive regulatory protein